MRAPVSVDRCATAACEPAHERREGRDADIEDPRVTCSVRSGAARRGGEAYEEATEQLYDVVRADPVALHVLHSNIQPRREHAGAGGGYVLDSLRSVRIALREQSYARVVQRAIAFGHDTDTTAALAGLRDGVDAIPSTWRLHEAGLAMVRPLADGLLGSRGMGRTIDWS